MNVFSFWFTFSVAINSRYGFQQKKNRAAGHCTTFSFERVRFNQIISLHLLQIFVEYAIHMLVNNVDKWSAHTYPVYCAHGHEWIRYFLFKIKKKKKNVQIALFFCILYSIAILCVNLE